MEVHNNDLDNWVCSLAGTHTSMDPVPDAFRDLPLSPLVSACVIGWATEGNAGRDIARRITIPEQAREVFPARFLNRFLPTAERCMDMIRKRRKAVRKALLRDGKPVPDRKKLDHLLLTTPRRRKKGAAHGKDGADEEGEGDEGEGDEGEGEEGEGEEGEDGEGADEEEGASAAPAAATAKSRCACVRACAPNLAQEGVAC